MQPVIHTLLTEVERDPLPAEHTSSHWQHFGQRTLIERRGNALRLQAAGFETLYGGGVASRVLQPLERYSYRAVTRRYRQYPDVWRTARRLVRDVDGRPTFTVFKSCCALAVLAEHWAASGLIPRSIVLIGDGEGFLGALIRRWLPGVRLWCIDLPKQLVFQARMHERAEAQVRMAVLSPEAARGDADVTFVRPQDVDGIPTVDCAVNLASMQEMTMDSIRRYFAFLRRRSTPQSRFYCVNRLQKELPGGEVTRFLAYPWQADDEVFLDEPCPYYTHFLALRVPFVKAFDGAIWHRLVRLAP